MNPRLLRPLATGFNPKSIAGLIGWWDAADKSTLFQNSDGTTPATAASDPVGYWADKSGLGRHAIQETANNRPTIGSQNSRTSLVFDGSNDLLNAAGAGVTGAAARSLFCVWKMNRTTGRNGIMGYSTGSGTGGWFQIVSSTAAASAGDIGFVGFSADLAPGGSITQNMRVGVATYDGTQIVLRKDGAVASSSNLSLSTLGSDVSFGGFTRATDFAQADICEALYFNRLLSAAEISRAERYLGRKWGVTVA
jgi:hypothetical protein